MQLSDDFLRETLATMGSERFERYLKAFEEESPVSIRVNPKFGGKRRVESGEWSVERGERRVESGERSVVPWCPTGFYLSARPQFTFDPLLHAGCYYVQEASSMFLDEVLRQHLPKDKRVAFLDMCAAPGGKSTLIRSAISEDSLLVSNEPVRKRASILLENLQKWGYANTYVTNNYPKDFRKARLQFDAILCDVPCSGEGMFRKDPATIGEWSQANVERCWQLQREIVSDAWQCLSPGGLLIYCTCTLNTKENEQNVLWMTDELGAELLPVAIKEEWGITGSLLPGFNQPVYRFIPGITLGEGLFMAVMRKNSRERRVESGEKRGERREESGERILRTLQREMSILSPLSSLHSPLNAPPSPLNTANLDYPTAISYLRGEAIVLPPDVPRGIVTVSFMGQPLGQVKNIGTRANNLYPKEWRIKSTHVPETYTPIFSL